MKKKGQILPDGFGQVKFHYYLLLQVLTRKAGLRQFEAIFL